MCGRNARVRHETLGSAKRRDLAEVEDEELVVVLGPEEALHLHVRASLNRNGRKISGA